MKIRTITVGIHLSNEDFVGDTLQLKVGRAQSIAVAVSDLLKAHSFEVQTVRLSTNSFEEWTDKATRISRVSGVLQCAQEHGFLLLSIGQATTIDGLDDIPSILATSAQLAASFQVAADEFSVPDYASCLAAANAMQKISDIDGGLRCFGFCASFGIQPHTPFFPASYHTGEDMGFSVGLENGDLLFLAFFGVTDWTTAQRNLRQVLRQTYEPLSQSLEELAASLQTQFFGLDASIVPSLDPAESVAKGFEFLPIGQFGHPGTLATCYTVTNSIKSLAPEVKLCGYSGVMLPVIEDVTLSARAAQDSPTYRIPDLLTYSSVCGVGLDSVPIPRSTPVEKVAGILMDVGSIAFRLHKPLSCRLFLTPYEAGEYTTYNSPYLCNTKVFSV